MKIAIAVMVSVALCASTFGFTMYSITKQCRANGEFKHAFYTYECRTQ